MLAKVLFVINVLWLVVPVVVVITVVAMAFYFLRDSKPPKD
jgi:hypothetical protein